MSSFKDIQCTGNANIEGDLNVQGEINKLQRDYFMEKSNYTDYLTIGNIGGGQLASCTGVKYGRVVTLFIQFNAVKQTVVDQEIFRFKDQHKAKYAPANYAVFPAFISIADCAVYIGQFADGHFSMAIMNGSLLNQNNQALILFTTTYITAE